MKQNSAHPHIKIWRLPDVDDVEFIRAAAMTQPTPKQFHQEFVIGVIEQGSHKLYYRGATSMASPGHLLLAQPGEILSCNPGEDGGYTFRALHGAPGRPRPRGCRSGKLKEHSVRQTLKVFAQRTFYFAYFIPALFV